MQQVLLQQQQTNQELLLQQQQTKKQLLNLMQVMLRSHDELHKLVTGGIQLQLWQYQTQLQHGHTSTLPLKRSADALQTEAQSSSRNAMRRQKKQALFERQAHVQQLASHRQELQDTSDTQNPDSRCPATALQHATCMAGPSSQSLEAAGLQPTDNDWRIPGSGGGFAWQAWLGAYTTLAKYPGLRAVYNDYQDGIYMPDGSRIAPLQLLERRLKLDKVNGNKAWRCGDVMRGHIADRLALIYAILRRLPAGGPYESGSPEVRSAIEELESLRSQHKAPGSNKVLTLKKLSEWLSKNEIKPALYEQQEFGWPPHKGMRQGNPRSN